MTTQPNQPTAPLRPPHSYAAFVLASGWMVALLIFVAASLLVARPTAPSAALYAYPTDDQPQMNALRIVQLEFRAATHEAQLATLERCVYRSWVHDCETTTPPPTNTPTPEASATPPPTNTQAPSATRTTVPVVTTTPLPSPTVEDIRTATPTQELTPLPSITAEPSPFVDYVVVVIALNMRAEPSVSGAVVTAASLGTRAQCRVDPANSDLQDGYQWRRCQFTGRGTLYNGWMAERRLSDGFAYLRLPNDVSAIDTPLGDLGTARDSHAIPLAPFVASPSATPNIQRIPQFPPP